MPRLWRPSIPLAVKLRVAMRQIGHADDTIKLCLTVWKKQRLLGLQLGHMLRELALNLRCEVTELRLDHDPPLAARPRFRRGLGKKTYYQPPANDPDHLKYRPHGAEHDGSHLIKTNVRGDHGQHSDRVLIKRERKRQKLKVAGAKTGNLRTGRKRSWGDGRSTGNFIISTDKLTEKMKSGRWAPRPMTSCVLGAGCICSERSRRKQCGNWRTQKIASKNQSETRRRP